MLQVLETIYANARFCFLSFLLLLFPRLLPREAQARCRKHTPQL